MTKPRKQCRAFASLLCFLSAGLFFFLFLQQLNLAAVALTIGTRSFSRWWRSMIRGVPKETRKGLNFLIILVAWEIWKHRNSCVFEGMQPNLQALLQTVVVESTIWCWVGASKLQAPSLGHQFHSSLGFWVVFGQAFIIFLWRVFSSGGMFGCGCVFVFGLGFLLDSLYLCFFLP